MVYIYKKNFKIMTDPILDRNGIDTDYRKCFECDDLIAPAVAILNKKGYKTSASCQGHFAEICYNNKERKTGSINRCGVCPYIAFEIKDLPSIPDGWRKVYTPENLIKRVKLGNKSGTCIYDNKEDIYKILEEEVPLKVSLYFDNDSILKCSDYFQFTKLLLKYMEELYNWAKNLKS